MKEDEALLATKKTPYGTVDQDDAEIGSSGKANHLSTGGKEDAATTPDKTQAAPAHSLTGILLIVLGSFSFSCMFLFVKVMQGTANSFTLVFYRSLVQIAISLTAVVRNHEHPLGASAARGWLLVRGGIGAAAVIAFFYAIQNMPLPDAVTLQFTTPTFAAIFAVYLANEEWRTLDKIGAVVCLVGVMLIAHPSWLFGSTFVNDGDDDDNDEETKGGSATKVLAIFVALLGAALAGMAYMSVRLIGNRASANVMVLYYGCLSIPMVLIGSKLFLGNWNVWGGDFFSPWDCCLLLLTGLSGYGGQYFTNLGLQKETAATGTLATCTQIVWTYIFELAFLHEGINGWSISGTVLILGFMIVVGVVKMKLADPNIHETVAGETEEAALLLASEQDVRHEDIVAE